MEENDKEIEYKNLVIRCSRLGGEAPFSYCEREGGDIPCRLVIDCWSRIFPVEAYLRKKMTEDAWIRLVSQSPRDRLTSLLDVVEKAKKRMKTDLD